MSDRVAVTPGTAARPGRWLAARIHAGAAAGGRAAFRTGAVLTLLFVVACGEEGGTAAPEPVPGLLSVTLTSPNGDEGAAVLESRDEGILEVTQSTGDAYLWTMGGTTRIVVLLEAPGSIGFTLRVEDVLSAPRLEVLEVADASNVLRSSLSGYELLVSGVGGV